MRRPEGLCESSVDNEAANSIAAIGTYSLDIRPSHSTTASVLLVVMRKTTPRRPVQTDLPLNLLLNAAAARALSFTLSPCLIKFSLPVTPTTAEARTEAMSWRGFVTSRQTFVHCGHNCTARLFHFRVRPTAERRPPQYIRAVGWALGGPRHTLPHANSLLMVDSSAVG